MPKFSDDENKFWTQLMHDANTGQSRVCQLCDEVIPFHRMLRHVLMHPDKTVYDIWSPTPVEIKRNG